MLCQSNDSNVVAENVLALSNGIKQYMRQPKDFIARYDAATFAVILSDATIDKAEIIAARICQQAEVAKKEGGLNPLCIGLV